jgi:hypothetical protein
MIIHINALHTKDWATRPTIITGVNSDAPKGYAVPASLLIPVVLLVL